MPCENTHCLCQNDEQCVISVNLESFIRAWKESFLSPNEVWEGQRAVMELKRHGDCMGFVLCRPNRGVMPREMLRLVLVEVRAYEESKRAWQREFKTAELFLSDIYRQTMGWSGKTQDATLKKLLENTAAEIENQRVELKRYRDGILPVGYFEMFWERFPRADVITRRIDIDTRLQLQLAKIFRTFLRKDDGVSTITIARMVVLVYKICSLAVERQSEGHLCLPGGKRKITVRNVEEKLRRKKLPGWSKPLSPRLTTIMAKAKSR
jgi:hypothetical protein